MNSISAISFLDISQYTFNEKCRVVYFEGYPLSNEHWEMHLDGFCISFETSKSITF